VRYVIIPYKKFEINTEKGCNVKNKTKDDFTKCKIQTMKCPTGHHRGIRKACPICQGNNNVTKEEAIHRVNIIDPYRLSYNYIIERLTNETS